jgi:hypothetical protein
MDDPQQEIEGVIVRLCTANRKDQELALKQYFTSDASFAHPFCSVTNNRDEIIRIYQWYKILSPKIAVSVDAVGMHPLSPSTWYRLQLTRTQPTINKTPSFSQTSHKPSRYGSSRRTRPR